MNIDEKKQKLINKEISVSDLSLEEVEYLKTQVRKELNEKKDDLNKLNKNIKAMKNRIDNWAN